MSTVLSLLFFFDDEVDDYVPPGELSDSDDGDDEFCEDIALYVNDGPSLSYRSKYLEWDFSEDGAGVLTKSSSNMYTLPHLVTLKFLLCLETSDPMSYNRQQLSTCKRALYGWRRVTTASRHTPTVEIRCRGS